jgi:hypothetical protein
VKKGGRQINIKTYHSIRNLIQYNLDFLEKTYAHLNCLRIKQNDVYFQYSLHLQSKKLEGLKLYTAYS